MAWMLTYDNGAIGMMYVEDVHRRRGLARAVLLSFLRLYDVLPEVQGTLRYTLHIAWGRT